MSSSCTPSTAIARWSSPSASIAVLARTITSTLSGVGAGRRAVQIRPFRLPAQPPARSGTTGAGDGSAAGGKGKKDEGRNLFVVRALSTGEQVMVFVEDRQAISRVDQLAAAATAASSKGKGKAVDQGEVSTVDDDDMVIVDLPTADDPPPPPPVGDTSTSTSTSVPAVHSQWSYISLGSTNAGSAAPPFDSFLQRVLLGGGAAANNPTAGAWIPRATAISLEGFVFSVGAAPGTVGDWEIRVEQVMFKGGAAGGTSRGLLVEVSRARREIPSVAQSDELTLCFASPLTGNLSGRAVPASRINLRQGLPGGPVPTTSAGERGSRVCARAGRRLGRGWLARATDGRQ